MNIKKIKVFQKKFSLFWQSKPLWHAELHFRFILLQGQCLFIHSFVQLQFCGTAFSWLIVSTSVSKSLLIFVFVLPSIIFIITLSFGLKLVLLCDRTFMFTIALLLWIFDFLITFKKALIKPWYLFLKKKQPQP